MKVLDLFSGIGGFSLGLERAGMETIAFCEIDPYCQKVLRKHWPDVPIYEDIKELDGTKFSADVVCGGFPCQPFSQAGKRDGTDDDRHLWPEMLRVISEVQPAWVLGENVAGIIGMELDTVLSDLEALGYATGTFVIPACAVDAPHRRDRVWIIGNANGNGESALPINAEMAELRYVANASSGRCGGENKREIQQPGRVEVECGSEDVADADGGGCRQTLSEPQRWQQREKSSGPSADIPNSSGERLSGRSDTRKNGEDKGGKLKGAGFAEFCQERGRAECFPEPPVGRVAHGIPSRVHRLRALGNAVVPQVVEVIGRAILENER